MTPSTTGWTLGTRKCYADFGRVPAVQGWLAWPSPGSTLRMCSPTACRPASTRVAAQVAGAAGVGGQAVCPRRRLGLGCLKQKGCRSKRHAQRTAVSVGHTCRIASARSGSVAYHIAHRIAHACARRTQHAARNNRRPGTSIGCRSALPDGTRGVPRTSNL